MIIVECDGFPQQFWCYYSRSRVAPAEVRIGYSRIRIEADQSIVITTPTMIIRDGEDGKPVLLTADRITLRPEGKLDLNKPLTLAAIEFERPILNLMMLPRAGAMPSTRPASRPSIDPVREVMKSLTLLKIHDGITLFPIGEMSDGANIVRGSASAQRDEHGEWKAHIDSSGIGGPFAGIFLPASTKVDLRFKIDYDNEKLSVQLDINAMMKGELLKKRVTTRPNSR